jgi:TRAP-type C4-dicarboxylate transport system permease large subunit
MFIIATAALFSWLLNRQGIPDIAAAWLVEVFDSPAMFLLGINLFLFVVGMFVETSASIIVLAPILATAAAKFGIDLRA